MTGWPHGEGQSLKTLVLDPEVPSPWQASQAHELDLGPEDNQAGLVDKSFLKQELKY